MRPVERRNKVVCKCERERLRIDVTDQKRH